MDNLSDLIPDGLSDDDYAALAILALDQAGFPMDALRAVVAFCESQGVGERARKIVEPGASRRD